MSGRATLLLLMIAAPARVVAVRTEVVDGRPTLRVLSVGTPNDVSLRREGADLVLSMEAEGAAALEAPAAIAPLTGISIRQRGTAIEVRIQAPPEVPYELRRDGSVISLLFGSGEQAKPAAPSFADLYRQIFPTTSEEAGAPPVGIQGAESAQQESRGLGLGRLSLRPSVTASYVDAETSLLDTPQPVRDRYLEVQPRLGAELPLGNGRLDADYEPRLRAYSSYDQVNRPSHLANASLELSVGARLTVGVRDHYARALLETREVDPGGEYFFQLGRFWRNEVGASLRVEVGQRLSLDFAGSSNRVRFVESSGFFGYDSRQGQAGLGFDATPNLRVGLSYVYDRVPRTELRPQAESTGHGVQLSLRGEILPLVSGSLAAGYVAQRYPGAAIGGQSYNGLLASGTLRKEFSRAASVGLVAGHETRLSAFEGNGFYVSTLVEADLTLAIPFSLSARGGAGYHWNEYRTAAAGLGAPRNDRIFGWSAGLGRAVSRWAFVRADYRRDRRNSNLSGLDNRTSALTVQLGIGLFGTAGSR